MPDLSVAAAFGAGIAAFLSPCILPLVPVYVAGLAGSSADGSVAETRRFGTLPLAIAFVIGFSAVFVPLGALAAYLGSLSVNYVDIIRKVGGVVLIVLGVHTSGLVRIPLLYREVRFDIKASSKTGVIRSLLMGLAFALGWTPCVGAVLGGILGLAYSSDTVWRGAWLLGVFCMGLGVPFIAVSLALGPAGRLLRSINRHVRIVSIVSGGILVALGILMVSGQLVRVTAWLARF